MVKTKSKKNCSIIDLEDLDIDHVILLNEISSELIADFNKLPEIIFDITNKNYTWFFTTIFSRNYYQSNLFLYCCYLALIDRILLSKQKINKIIVPSKAFKKVLENYLSSYSQKINIENKSKKNYKLRFKNFILKNFGLLYSLNYCLKLFISKNTERTKKIIDQSSVRLIDTFILQNSINEGKYIERNYPGMLKYVKDKDRNSIFFVPHIIAKHKPSDLQKIYELSEENIVYKQDFLKIQDYIYSLISIIKIHKLNNVPIIFKNFNILPLINDEIAINKYVKSISGLLNFHFIKRLKNKKVDLKLVLDWFENQILDKGLNFGVNTFYPNISHIGYKGYNNTDGYIFYTNPTEFEVSNKLIPKTLAIIGEGYKNINKKYYSNQKLLVTGGFRFSKLWDSKRIRDNVSNKKKILVVLPIIIKESIEILELIINSVNKINTDIIYNIKLHPALDINAVVNYFDKNWPSYFHIIDEDLIKIASHSNLVLGSGTTSCFEALALGIPVIIIGSQSNLTKNPIPTTINGKIWKLVYKTNELRNYTNFYLNLNSNQIKELDEIGSKIKDEFFTQITQEKVNKLLNLSN